MPFLTSSANRETEYLSGKTTATSYLDVGLWRLDERSRKELAKEVRDELKTVGGITKVDVVGDRDYEISVEISQQDLERYGLTFSQIVDAVRGTSIDVAGGSIKTLTVTFYCVPITVLTLAVSLRKLFY